MLHSARIKLTFWYLLIIMLISGFFSLAFYNVSTREIHRIINRIESREERANDPSCKPPPPRKFRSVDELKKSEENLRIMLILINGIILLLAGGAGYFLAGRTLKPIKNMLDDQNRFITDASHELRTPLTSLRSEIEVHLRDKNLTLTQAKKLLQSNLEEVLSLQTLSDRLIELTTYQKNTTTFTQLSLTTVLEAAIKKVTPLAKSKRISIDNRVKNVTILGDEQRLSELFTILLDNAIKYSPKKTTIKMQATKTNHAIEVKISDQGIGIDQEDLPYIFDRFYRANKARSKIETEGYGLGLSIARSIVEAHNGIITVESKLNKPARNATHSVAGGGTTFSVRFQIKSLS